MRRRTALAMIIILLLQLLLPGLGGLALAAAPAIISLSPASGTMNGGTQVTISGQDFTGSVQVLFGGMPGTITFQSSTSLKVTTPPAAAPGAVDVEVRNPDGSAIKPNGFTYISAPTISGVTPQTGVSIGGDTITISGSWFDTSGGVTVTVGGRPATNVQVVNQNTITATVPAGKVGPASVTVTNPDGGAATLAAGAANGFSYTLSSPQITGVTPAKGSRQGGTLVSVTGSDLGADAQVKIGPYDATVVQVDSGHTELTVLTPAGSEGTYDVQVVNADGASATLPGAFTYMITPVITDITPNYGLPAGGTTVVLRGSNFLSGMTPGPDGSVHLAVYVGNLPAAIQGEFSDAEITILTPPGQGAADVMVQNVYNPDQAVTVRQGFIYQQGLSQPLIESVTPGSGPLAGNTAVVIYGRNFLIGADGTLPQVYIGNTPAQQVQVVSTNIIKAVTPAAAAPGAADVKVINPDGGTAVLPNGYVYRPGALVVTDVTPNSGPVSGLVAGQPVSIVINGANFYGQLLVIIGDQVAPITAVDPSGSKITVTLPASTPGLKSVYVENEYGSAVLPDAFTYFVPESAPKVYGVTPAAGPARGGTAITISGDDFRSGALVTVGGAPARQVTVTSSTYITAVTPPGLPGPQDVVVTNPDGGWGALPGGFRYVSTPSISSASPNLASTAGGAIIALSGEDFYPGAQVVVGSVYAPEVFVESTTRLLFRLPAGSAGAQDITVTNTDGGTATLAGGLTRQSIASPTLTSVTPYLGPTTGGSQVLLEGSGFRTSGGRYKVYFGWAEATGVSVVSASALRAVTPPNAVGSVAVTVVNTVDGSAAVLDKVYGFEYRQPFSQPAVSSVSPDRGPRAGGTYVTIRGQDFLPGAQVLFGDAVAAATNVSEDGSTIKVFSPPGPLGTVEVRVINSDGATAGKPNAFTYKSPDSRPVIDGVTPAQGATAGGTVLTVHGQDFRDGAQVYLDGLPAPNVQVLDLNTIRATTPAHPAGTVEVTVVNRDGGTATLQGAFTYGLAASEPRITSLTPNRGSTLGGTQVLLTGDDFRSGVRVFFGATEALQVTLVNYKTIQAVTPPGPPGPVDVRVENPDLGAFTLAGGFTYETTHPAITSISPALGPLAGGTVVDVRGSDFQPGLTVTFGGNPATVVSLAYEGSEDLARVTLPPGRQVGPVDVTLTNPDGGAATRAGGFSYKSPDSRPAITSLDPVTGSTLGGTWVSIAGSDLRQGAGVYFDGLAASRVTWVSDQLLRAQAPAHAAGTVDVSVVNVDGGAATAQNAFTYRLPGSEPAISGVDPPKGPSTGGTAITITGRDFRAGARVYVGGAAATRVVVVNYRTITAVTPAGQAGAQEVMVVNPDEGAFTLPKAFTYVQVTPPVVNSVSPAAGPSTGGTRVTIGGSNFQKGAVVDFGGVAAIDVKFVSASALEATTPAGSVGPVDVRVTNPDGGAGVKSAGFTYQRPRSVPDTPGGLWASGVSSRAIRLTWDPVEFASYYEVFRSSSSDGPWHFLDQTTGTTYYATGLSPDTRYYFKVRAVNELGSSGLSYYDYAYTREEDEDGAREDFVPAEPPQEVAVQLSGGELVARIPSAGALRRAGYLVNFNRPDARGGRWVVLLARAAAAEAPRLEVLLPGLTLDFPAATLIGALPGVSSSEEKDAYLRLGVDDLGQQEAERLARQLPAGARVLSPVYSLSIGSQVGRVTKSLDHFQRPVEMALDYWPAAGAPGRKAIYHLNRYSGRWEEIPSTHSDTWYRVTGQAAEPGRYVLVSLP